MPTHRPHGHRSPGRSRPRSHVRGASGFSPSEVTGLTAWYKADSLGLSDGTGVSSWADSSGSGNTVTQSNAALRPTYKANIINGQPVVRWNPSDNDEFLTSSASPTVADGTAPFTFFTVSSSTMLTGAQRRITGWNPNSVGWLWGHQPTTATISRFTSGGIANYEIAAAFGPANTFIIHSVLFDASADATLWRDGTSLGTTAGAAMCNAAGVNPFVIGTEEGVNGMWDGDIAEILIYTGALSTANRRSVESYLGSKYGITVA